MTDIAIQVEGLGKRYEIGERDRYHTLRDVVSQIASAPLRLLSNRAGPKRERSEIWALKDISFEIKRGEVVGVIGRNGAGKSTLLKILSKITEPTEGYARIRGRVGSLLEVGTGFHPELTGRENIYLNGAIIGMKRVDIDRKFDEIVAFAEVEQFLDTPVKHYSSGMHMRLAFAVSAHLDPDILIVDEVLAVGDAEFRKKCLAKMGDVASHSRAIMFVTHDMTAVINLCSRALLLERGMVVADGQAPAIVRQYADSIQSPSTDTFDSSTGREGRGRIRFVRAWIEDEAGRRIDYAMSGQTITIALRYESADTRVLTNSRISVSVEDLLGQTLFLCSTELPSAEPLHMPASGTARCVIRRLPLSQGTYRLSLFLEVNREVEDWLQSAHSLNVLDGDFFGSGRQYPPGWQGQGVLVPHTWSVVDHADSYATVSREDQRTQRTWREASD